MPITLDGTNGVFLPSWTTATRPASPANGEIGYNSTTGQIDQYVGGAWSSVPTAGASQATATALGTVYALQTTSGASPYLTAFGYGAGAVNNASGVRNTAVGLSAMQANTSGSYNVVMGMNALYTNITGSSNTAIGQNTLFANTASDNTAVGYAVLQANTSGSYNIAVGSQSLASNTTSSASLAIGAFSLQSSTGGGNIGVGHGTGQNGVSITTGTYNICVGVNASTSAAADTNEITISANSGNNISGKGSSTGFISPNGGGVYQGNNSTSWAVTSDQRLKKNIVDNNVGLNKINQIQIRNFEYRNEDEVTDLPKNQTIKKEGLQLGVIAQELQQILPDCVKTESTGVMSVDSTDIMWHMINAIKELSAEVNALKARLGA